MGQLYCNIPQKNYYEVKIPASADTLFLFAHQSFLSWFKQDPCSPAPRIFSHSTYTFKDKSYVEFTLEVNFDFEKFFELPTRLLWR
jgi:hypothetical protein